MADSRVADALQPETPETRFDWVITSPPYYGMRTYIPDQWLRNWFVGGPDAVDYTNRDQVVHSGYPVRRHHRQARRPARPHQELPQWQRLAYHHHQGGWVCRRWQAPGGCFPAHQVQANGRVRRLGGQGMTPKTSTIVRLRSTVIEPTPSRPGRDHLARRTDAGLVPCSATIPKGSDSLRVLFVACDPRAMRGYGYMCCGWPATETPEIGHFLGQSRLYSPFGLRASAVLDLAKSTTYARRFIVNSAQRPSAQLDSVCLLY